MLGFNRTHHMLHVHTDQEGFEMPEWTRALKAKYRGEGTFTKLDWDRLLGDCQGVVDYPSAFFVSDLAQLYPDAKVVILNRDPEKWYESVSETVTLITRPSFGRICTLMYASLFDKRVRDMKAFWKEVSHAEGNYDHFAEKDKAIAFMQEKYDECRRVVAPERRIEFKVQDGWEPLCRHLGVEVPMVEDPETGRMVVAPFPRVNDRALFKGNVDRGLKKALDRANEAVFGLLGRGVVVGAVGWAAYVGWKMYGVRR